MSGWKKLAAASAAGGGGLDVDEVFSTYLYTGNGSSQTITNGIDLAGEGGMVWVKNRDSNTIGGIGDTERGTYNLLAPSETLSGLTGTTANITAFNSDGFGVGTGNYTLVNYSGHNYASWTFRKAPKFFDVVTYTGTGSPRTVSHNLGSAPGCIFIKCTSLGTTNWLVYHRGEGANKFAYLNAQNSFFTNTGIWQNTAPTSTDFYIGTGDALNGSGQTYVAYLWAHNDGDGGFGPDGDQDIIKCGSYTTTGSGIGSVDLGFEPQWILVRASEITNNWFMADNMRGWSYPTSSTASTMQYLFAHSSAAESDTYLVDPTATGFDYRGSGSNRKYIYMAIRRGSLSPPESGTEVFNVDITATAASGATPSYVSGFPVDMGLYRRRSTTAFWSTSSRLTQGRGLSTTSTDAEYGDPEMQFDYMTGWKQQDGYAIADQTAWMWKRAPGYFDVVAYKGNGTAGRTVSHNLGVAPEMMWVKKRNVAGGNWIVYHSKLNVNSDNAPETDYIVLNGSSGADDYIGMWNDTAPTVSNFTLGSYQEINNNNDTFIAYLFASLPGVSKVGSYTGNGSSQTINCDFTSGARFILIKRTDNSGDWYIWDSVRGITAGSDPHLALNTTAAELTYRDSIDPANSGFIVNETANSNINVSSASYIFYAIA